MPIRHIVIFEVDEVAPFEDIENAFGEAKDLLTAIPDVRDLVGGLNVNPNAKGRRYGLTMEFDNMATFRSYIAHDNHAAALTAIRPFNKAATNIQLAI